MATFDTAPQTFASLIVENLGREVAEKGRIVRDIYGHLSFATTSLDAARSSRLTDQAIQTLGVYAAPTEGLIVWVDPDELHVLMQEPSVEAATEDGATLRMIDRRLAGEDWLTRAPKLVESPQRLVFYSIKGGVGRSTGLAVTAADLAARDLNVLVIDLDLEAPGLGSMLLYPDDMPNYGVVDWFAALAVGADVEEMALDMTGSSPFTSPRSIVDIVPAHGKLPGAYLAKLARAYTPGSADKKYSGLSFPEKTNLLITQLCARQRYDVVLIDARAGLHETSGGLILGLGAKALLFGIDTTQTFDDFALLFRAFHDALDPALNGEDLRNSFKMVHGKAPRDEKDQLRFRERSWGVWSNYLYDDVDPSDEISENRFVFDLGNEDAPHYPLEIIGDESYARFDPRTETYSLNADAYAPIFGRFLDGIRTLLGLK